MLSNFASNMDNSQSALKTEEPQHNTCRVSKSIKYNSFLITKTMKTLNNTVAG